MRPVVAADTETELARAGLQAPPLACLSAATHGAAPALVHWTEAAETFDALLRSDATIVGHNFAYDVCVMLAHEPGLWPAVKAAYESDRVTDTMIRDMLIANARGRLNIQEYALEACAARHLKRQLDKGEDGWRLRYGELRPLPLHAWPERAKAYALNDAQATLDVYDAQEPHADALLRDQFRQTRAGLWIQMMRCRGVVTDPPFVEAYREETIRERNRLSEILRREGLLRPDKQRRDGTIKDGSCDQAAVRARVVQAYAKQGKPTPYVQPKSGKESSGNVAYDKRTLEESLDPVLIAYKERASLTKILTEELPILMQGAREPIHARRIVLKESGRQACKEPNLDNRPRRFGAREGFVPRPGYVFAAADFGGLELATMAQVCLALLGRSTLATMLNEGIDPHTIIAAQILGCSYEEGIRRKKLKPKDKHFDNARQCGKVVNFGKPGGIGAARLVQYAKQNYGVDMTEEFARDLIAIWMRTFPEMKSYLRLVGDIVEREGKIVQIYTDRIRGGVGYTDACNTFYQGLGSDVFKAAGWAILCEQWDPASPLWGTHTVLSPHDEFLLEVPDDEDAHDAAVRLGYVMARAARPFLPDVRLEAEPYLSRRWSKDAGPVFGSNGRLVPWEVEGLAA